MVTPAEILTLINNEITTNGNNEITAEVMRPVLSAMVNQINGLVGNGTNLPNGYTDVITALNTLSSSLANEFEDFTADFNFAPSVSVGRYKGDDDTVTVFLPNAATNTYRELTVVNGSITENINFDVGYIDFDGSTTTLIPLSSVIKIKSNGTNWYRIG